MLYPQNGDRIVTMDTVTLLHPMYILGVRNLDCVEYRDSSCQYLLSHNTNVKDGRTGRVLMTNDNELGRSLDEIKSIIAYMPL